MAVDLQSQPVGKGVRSKRNLPGHVSEVLAAGAQRPDERQVALAAEILSAAKRPCILAGRGAFGAATELAAVAERLGAPMATALLGKGVLADGSPDATGGVGLLGTRPSQDALEGCDALLIVGRSFPYIEFHPPPGQARCVQIDIDPTRIGLRHPAEAALVGNAAACLRALLPRLERRADRSFLEQAQAGMRQWRELMQDRGTRPDRPMKPQVVAHELSRLLADDAIVTTDSGTITTWAARHIAMHGRMMFACSGTLATMGCALPYAIGAAVAYPGRQVVAFIGDGGLTMVLGELATCAKYGLDVKIVVIKNNSLGQIKWEQMVFLGNPEYGCELQPIGFAEVARGFGIEGFRVEDPAECGEVLRAALAAPGPALVEAVVDPHEPPMPPRVELKQAAHFAEALARGTPHRGAIALTAASNTVRELI